MQCKDPWPIKRGDAVLFKDHLEVHGISVDMAGAVVRAILRNQAGDIVFNELAEVMQTGDDQDRNEHNIQYQADSDETDEEPGIYDFEWHVSWSATRNQTYPRGGYHKVKIVNRLTD